MRPEPTERHEHDPSGRIIYLGDVRRRREGNRHSADSHYLAAIALSGLAAWAVWAVVLFTLSPSKLLTYLAFFIPLAIALTATGTLGAYAVEQRRQSYAGLRTAGRRGVSFAAVIAANLVLLAAHKWTLVVLAVTVLLAVALDVISSRRN